MSPVYGGILISSLSWSLFDLSRKKLAVDLSPVPVVAWLTLFQGFVFLGLSVFSPWQFPVSTYWIPFAAGVALNAFANIWFVESVSLAPFSLAIPILSLTPVFSSVGGWLILQESLSARQTAGIAVIVSATLAMGYFGTTSLNETEVTNPKAVRKGLVLMAAVALLFALTPVVDKLCLKTIPSSEHGTLQCFATWGCLMVWIRARGGGVPFSRIRAKFMWFLGAVVFATLAIYFQFLSIQSISVGIFEALKRSCGLVTALGLGFFVFKEAFTTTKLLLVVVMGAGIFILLT